MVSLGGRGAENTQGGPPPWRQSPPSTRPPTAPLTRSVNGRLRLTYPTRGYAVSRNPFAIWAVLPLITLAFAGLAVAEHLGDYSVGINWFGATSTISLTVAAFVIVTLGLLLVPAVTLKGSLNLTHDGITFERGKQHLTAGWEQVTGLVHRPDAGLCLTMAGAQQTTARMRLPGGFNATDGTVRIPLRMFGDRQFSILYDIRDRLPEASWLPALQKVKERSPRVNLAIYAGGGVDQRRRDHRRGHGRHPVAARAAAAMAARVRVRDAHRSPRDPGGIVNAVNSSTPLGDAVEEVSDAARAAVAFVKPRLRGVLHEAAFPVSLLGGAWAILHAPAGSARTSTAIYAATLSACLGVSAMYHRGHWSVRARAWLRRLDHATIFLLIAGHVHPHRRDRRLGMAEHRHPRGGVGRRAGGQPAHHVLERRAGGRRGRPLHRRRWFRRGAPPPPRRQPRPGRVSAYWRWAARCTSPARSSTRSSDPTRGRAPSGSTRSSTRWCSPPRCSSGS